MKKVKCLGPSFFMLNMYHHIRGCESISITFLLQIIWSDMSPTGFQFFLLIFIEKTRFRKLDTISVSTSKIYNLNLKSTISKIVFSVIPPAAE